MGGMGSRDLQLSCPGSLVVSGRGQEASETLRSPGRRQRSRGRAAWQNSGREQRNPMKNISSPRDGSHPAVLSLNCASPRQGRDAFFLLMLLLAPVETCRRRERWEKQLNKYHWEKLKNQLQNLVLEEECE